MRLPTVRVKHPMLGFITINASDLTAEHELHEEQAEDFDPALLRSSAVCVLDPALRDAAAALGLGMVAMRRQMEGLPFNDLPSAEKLVAVREAQAEFDASAARYEADQREREAYEARERERASTEGQPDQAEKDPPAEDEPKESDEAADLSVAKGPGGRWFVMRGEERASKGYGSEGEAQAALAEMRAAG